MKRTNIWSTDELGLGRPKPQIYQHLMCLKLLSWRKLATIQFQESVCSSSCPGLRINVSKLVVFDYEIGILRRGLRGWISSLWGRSHFDKAPSRRRQSDVSRTEVSWPSFFLPLKETFPRQSGGKVHHEYPAEGLENAFSSTGKRESPSQA